MKPLLFANLVIAICTNVWVAHAGRNQFKHWYPDYRAIFSDLIENNCSKQYEAYLRQEKPLPHPLDQGKYRFVAPVIDCLMENTPETIKANMASASVFLGLAPAILSLAGSTLAEMSLLATRRPLLALCIAIASPFVLPTRAFDYENPAAPLAQPVAPVKMASLTPMRQMMAVFVQYVLAFAAIANIFTTMLQLQDRTVTTQAFDNSWTIMIWNAVIVLGFFSNTIALHLRVDTDSDDIRHRHELAGSCVIQAVRTEFTPCVNQPRLVLRWKLESYGFIAVSYFTATKTVCYLLYGTFVFSSVMFISTRDAVAVFARLLASVMLCRIILMFELAGLRKTAREHGDARESDEAIGEIVKVE